MAVSGLRKSLASGMEMLARSVAAFSVAIRLGVLLLSAAALPVLWQCGLIAVYRCTHQCGERSNAASRKQSAAKQTSLAPHDSKARLQSVITRRRFMAKPCTPHLHCAARAVIQAANSQCAGSRGKAPRPFLLGGVRGDVLFPRKENIPPCRIPTRCGAPSHPTVRQYEPPPCMAGTPTRQGSHNTAPSRRRSCRRPQSRRPGRLPFRPR